MSDPKLQTGLGAAQGPIQAQSQPTPPLSPQSSQLSPQLSSQSSNQSRNPPLPLNRQCVGAPLLPMALGTWLSLPAVWPSLSASWIASAPNPNEPQTANPLLTPPLMELFSAWLAPIREQIPPNLDPAETAELAKAITQEALKRFGAFLSGVRQYQSFPAAREETPDVQEILRLGTTRLLDYAPFSQGRIIFVVPSLVNRFEILDIDPQHSFLRFLVSQGFRPVVIDWQEPGEEETTFTLSDYMLRRLVPLLACATMLNQGQPCHVLGYCMGGVMSLALALLKPAQVATLTLLATPWDFAAKGVGGVPAADTTMGKHFIQQAQQAEAYLDQVGLMPSALLQSIFTGFQSLQVLEKFSRFGTQPHHDDEARRFVLTEDWLNNGVPLALPVAKECLHDWYQKNLTCALRWSVAGQLIDPREIGQPTYILVPARDKIVPPESARPLAALIKGAVLHEPDIGHVGLMTGDEAPEKVWKNYALWLGKQ